MEPLISVQHHPELKGGMITPQLIAGVLMPIGGEMPRDLIALNGGEDTGVSVPWGAIQGRQREEAAPKG